MGMAGIVSPLCRVPSKAMRSSWMGDDNVTAGESAACSLSCGSTAATSIALAEGSVEAASHGQQFKGRNARPSHSPHAVVSVRPRLPHLVG